MLGVYWPILEVTKYQYQSLKSALVVCYLSAGIFTVFMLFILLVIYLYCLFDSLFILIAVPAHMLSNKL